MTTRITRDTATHPEGTIYDVLVPSHAARVRGVSLERAISAYRMMRCEGLERAILVAYLPDATRFVGCTGVWEDL